ncbi:hypothetical protein TESG_08403 [Trichophyton tonsurans CBS 112818]|uniref:Uncharacterized protein n=1 Tax=Trichophyton tonsurans (strain CBS 112818) TaxID=647933 RepID=F2RW84_TRIT1|nr:hypothetical protein TESG_08403 [Trichophyton tonsurans CBS 112818]
MAQQSARGTTNGRVRMENTYRALIPYLKLIRSRDVVFDETKMYNLDEKPLSLKLRKEVLEIADEIDIVVNNTDIGPGLVKEPLVKDQTKDQQAGAL